MHTHPINIILQIISRNMAARRFVLLVRRLMVLVFSGHALHDKGL